MGRESGFAPVIVIARHAVDRAIEPRENFERFGEIFFLFDKVARKANEVGRERVDFGHHCLEELSIPFVVDIGDVDEAMSGQAAADS